MDDTKQLEAAVAQLANDVQALIAKPVGSVQPQLDTITTAVQQLDAIVQAAAAKP